ncbi:MAG: hypothetical protein QOJ09_3159, partial [Actinomycetota bacterium]|nr:hypothetical protein [Actinomycetota bacterium]
MSDRPAPEPGWHEDPWGEAPLRWWDGTAWAPATATDAESPAPTGTTASATGARSDPPSSIGFRAVGWALGAFVLSLVASVVLSLAAHAVFRHTDIAWVLGGQ